jgi:hypothetical protein
MTWPKCLYNERRPVGLCRVRETSIKRAFVQPHPRPSSPVLPDLVLHLVEQKYSWALTNRVAWASIKATQAPVVIPQRVCVADAGLQPVHAVVARQSREQSIASMPMPRRLAPRRGARRSGHWCCWRGDVMRLPRKLDPQFGVGSELRASPGGDTRNVKSGNVQTEGTEVQACRQ